MFLASESKTPTQKWEKHDDSRSTLYLLRSVIAMRQTELSLQFNYAFLRLVAVLNNKRLLRYLVPQDDGGTRRNW